MAIRLLFDVNREIWTILKKSNALQEIKKGSFQSNISFEFLQIYYYILIHTNGFLK